MLWQVWRHLNGGWIDRHLVEPPFHFTYYGFDWVKVWPGSGIYVHFYALGLLSLCIAVGFCYRLAVALFWLGFTYVFLLEQALYLNHYYLICLVSFLLIFVPAHRNLSLDAWLRPSLHAETVAAWPLWVLRTQMGLVYFYAGVAKINRDWLEGWPLRMWLPERNDLALIGPLLEQGWVAMAFSHIGLWVDLLAAPMLLWRRTRLCMFLLLVSFHLLNLQLFNIGVFPWFSVAITLLFFPPDWPRRVFNWPRRAPIAAMEPASSGFCHSLMSRSAVVLFVVYFLVQVLLPLRHFLYLGNVSWTEEGHRFSWHMKLRDKDAFATFAVINSEDEKSIWKVDPFDELTDRQQRKMASRPYMVQQYAHHLADRAEAELGWKRVQVRADVQASLNGRPEQPLVDPTVDLAAEPRTFFHPKRWIVPLQAADP